MSKEPSNFWMFIFYSFAIFRHIVLRQDHYECAVLLLMRGARLDVKNKNGKMPSECMSGSDAKAKSIIRLSTTLHQMMAEAKTTARSERVVRNDVTKAKETNPIQCVNSVDEEDEPSDYVYVSKNCVTNSVPIDRNIAKLQVSQRLYFMNVMIRAFSVH